MASSPPCKRSRTSHSLPGNDKYRDHSDSKVTCNPGSTDTTTDEDNVFVPMPHTDLQDPDASDNIGSPAASNQVHGGEIAVPALADDYLSRCSDSPISFEKVFEGLSSLEQEKWTSPRRGTLAWMRIVLARRFQGLKIYVDDIRHMPRKVWYQGKYEEDLEDSKVFLCGMLNDPIISEEIQKKWDVYITNDKKICLGFIMLAFKKLEDHMVYDAHRSLWKYNPDATQVVHAIQGPSRSSSESSDEETLPHKQKQKKKVEKDAKGTTYVMKALQSYYFFDFDLVARISAALASLMRNSAGRDTVAMLVRCACRLAFGVDFERSGIFIYQVGTSNYPFEGFPVSLKSPRPKCSSFQEGGGDTQDNPLALENAPSEITDPESESSFGRGFGKGYIYPDLVIASENCDNAKFLLLIEVKSNERLHERDHCQLFCNTVGALVEQSHVYGLIMSHSNATLLKVSRHENPAENNAIMCVRKDYMLLKHLVSRPFFDRNVWFQLFTDIIKVLDAAKQGITNVL